MHHDACCTCKTRQPLGAGAGAGAVSVLFRVLKLMLPLAAASAQLAPACCVAACGRGMAVAALRSTLPPTQLLDCRCYSHAVFYFIFVVFLVCRVSPRLAAHPYSPPQFRRRRLQGLVCLVRKHTIMMGRGSTVFCAEGRSISEHTFSQLLSIVCSQFKIVPGVAHCSVFFELLYLYQELHTGDYGGGLGKQDLLYSNILIFSYFYQQYLVLFAMAPRKNCSSVVVPAF